MRIAIVGSAGFIGSALTERLQTAASVIGIDRRASSTTDFVANAAHPKIAATLVGHRPDVIIHCAAEKSLTACETEVRHFASNVSSVAYCAKAAEECGAHFIFLSSDMVFGARGGPFFEASVPCPVNEYGRWKTLAEQIVLSVKRGAVIRTSFVFGPQRRPTRAARRQVPANQSEFCHWVADRVRRSESVLVARNFVSNPTPLAWLVEGVRTVVEREAVGVFHLSGPVAMSRAEFAAEVCSAVGADPNLVSPVDVPLGPRPPDVSLDVAATYGRLGLNLDRKQFHAMVQRALHDT